MDRGCVMPDYTQYQQKLITRYYDKRDEIMLGKLGEIVTELYLADTEKQETRLWSRADKAMKALKVPDTRIEHILTQRNPEVLARNLRGWLSAAKKASPPPGQR